MFIFFAKNNKNHKFFINNVNHLKNYKLFMNDNNFSNNKKLFINNNNIKITNNTKTEFSNTFSNFYIIN